MPGTSAVEVAKYAKAAKNFGCTASPSLEPTGLAFTNSMSANERLHSLASDPGETRRSQEGSRIHFRQSLAWSINFQGVGSFFIVPGRFEQEFERRAQFSWRRRPHAEFLYACVPRTIERDLPNETAFLQRYDQFRQHVDAFIDMPERLIDLLFRFLYQNGGQLSNRAREKEFAALTNDEAERIEEIYAQTFGAD
ncbi:hypothetical protein MPL3356_270052 [Mesorhizobium plurifarium]|uniref:Uncharacterized protein n=1 Tax=Mesorhizobium plurifarium TaxID=69974 RepID=A0A090DPD9_MESPL|nr:hypothetical protein [Mesorhizobium sp. LCM 4577]CDX18307.1 hypothetical protein MPL3356_270052 [Mesorhizobium plurifarium]CDX20919.1 hypothetical protein MPLB_1990003 [Mesorhizobium sp. ORS 3324]